MTLTDKELYKQVLGCLIHNPLLLVEYDINIDDFDIRIAKIVFMTITSLLNNGAEKLSCFEIDNEIENHEATATIYRAEGGVEWLQDCDDFSLDANFNFYYDRLKKLSLLRTLQKNNYDISHYYKENPDTLREESELIDRMDEATVEEILNTVENKYNDIRAKFLHGGKNGGDIAGGLQELVDNFSKTPDVGPSLCGSLFSTACRGARPGIFLLRSASTNTGKAIPNYTIIPMADGTNKRVDEVKVGDYLIGSDGKPTKVLNVWPQAEKKQVYRIWLSCGKIAECCSEHLWTYTVENRIYTSSLAKLIKHYYNAKKKIYIPTLDNGMSTISAIIATNAYTDMTCFTVDAEDALFCMNDYIITHNTRLSVYDSVKIAFPEHWSFEKGTFVREVDKNGELIPARKTLYITTEMDKDEIRTIVLSNLAGVDEEHILTGRYEFGEKERISYAIKIIEKYRDYYFVDQISDPDLNNVSATIKKYATLNGVKFVFFDYVFTSPALLAQFNAARIREDVALALLSNQLKQLAVDYNLFIASSTQVNAKAMEEDGFKDESCIRGSRAVAD